MRIRRISVAAALLAFGVDSSGAAITYPVILDGNSESPPTSSAGTGLATAIVDDKAHTLSVMISFASLTGTTTASHIHCCTATPLSGNAGVATTTPTFAGFPLGVTSGTYFNSLDLTQASSYNPSFITASGGTTSSAEAALLRGMASGAAYLNIHSSVNPGGEIRGFLLDRLFVNGFDGP